MAIDSNPRRRLRQITGLALSILISAPAYGYEFPLSSSAIRDGYFIGKRPTDLDGFFASYIHTVPDLSVGKEFVTRVRLETPFAQVVDRVSKTLNYSAQAAEKDFYDKPAILRIYLEICYMPNAPLPNAVRIAVLQNGKLVEPDSDERSAFFPATDPYTSAPNLGEKVTLDFAAKRFDSSTLTIRIDTPDGQHGTTEFDLQTLK